MQRQKLRHVNLRDATKRQRQHFINKFDLLRIFGGQEVRECSSRYKELQPKVECGTIYSMQMLSQSLLQDKTINLLQ